MDNNRISQLQADAIGFLQELIRRPSFSREEAETASFITKYLFDLGMIVSRAGNNVFASNKFFDESKPAILPNSHHDTVRPNPQYTRDPFQPLLEGGRLYGLGSNDAGGALASLLAAFRYFHDREGLKYNLVFAATAEEEISGAGGIESVIPYLPPIDCAIVGEPTNMELAVAERGLMVLDCVATGAAGHAARNEGVSALYMAVDDIGWFRNYAFPKVSGLLGPVKMTVTVIETENKAHNVVPGTCRFVVDVRMNELYTSNELLQVIRASVKSSCQPRSTRLRSTLIPPEHPLVQAGIRTGRKPYGSPTSSDKALMPFPALKMGPGESGRSHTADEFIYVSEIEEGIEGYIQLLNELL